MKKTLKNFPTFFTYVCMDMFNIPTINMYVHDEYT